MNFAQTLFADGGPHTALSKYTAANGAFYMLSGCVYLAAPNLMHTLLGDAAPAFVGTEIGLVRALGLTLFVIGWLYFFGAKTRAASFALSTVIDRVVFVPLVLVPLVALGQLPAALGVPFAILDPVLGLGALVIWSRTRSA